MVVTRCHHIVVQPLYDPEFTEFYCSSECYADGLSTLATKFKWRAVLIRKPDGKVEDYSPQTKCASCGSSIPRGSRDARDLDDAYQ